MAVRSLALRYDLNIHQAVKRTFTLQLSNRLDTRKGVPVSRDPSVRCNSFAQNVTRAFNWTMRPVNGTLKNAP